MFAAQLLLELELLPKVELLQIQLLEVEFAEKKFLEELPFQA